MKHLLIILISFLLLSSFLISCEKKEGTLYKWGKYPPYVWKGFGDKETHPKYEGDVENGKPNGLGFLIYPWGTKYVGEWKDGEYHGEGTYSWSDGRKNVGEFKDNYEWNVIEHDKNGNIIGKWVNGKYDGQGTLTSLFGTKYVGEFKDGKKNGQGTYIYGIGKLKGEKYEGEWKNGERTGQGTYTWSNGDKYVGEYKDEKPWNGTYYDKDGNITGKYVNGVKQ